MNHDRVRQRAMSLLAGSVLVVVAVAFWKARMVDSVPMPQKVIRWSADLYEQYVPAWTFAYRGPRFLPQWNPWQLAGTGGVAITSSGLLYPLNFLAVLIPVPQALGWLSAAHITLAGVLTFASGRVLGLARPASALAAVAFMLSEPVLGERIHTLYLFGICWIPGVLLASVRLLAAPGLRAGSLLGAVLAVQLLTGYGQIVCFTGYALVVLVVTWLLVSRSDGRRMLLVCTALVIAVGTAAAVAAVQLLPTLELMQHTGRGAEHLPLAEIMVFPPPSLGQVLGASGWMLALAAAGATERRRRATVAAGAVVVTLAWLVALGTRFYSLVFYRLPGVALFRLPERILPIGELALAMLAAVGLACALDGGRRRLAGTLALSGGAVLLAAGTRQITTLAVLVAGALAFVPWRRAQVAAAWAVVALIVVARWMQPGSIIMMPENNDPAYFASPPIVEFLRGRIGIDRALVIKNWTDRFPLMERLGTLHRIPVAQDYEPMTPVDYALFLAPLRNAFIDPRFGGRYFPGPSHPAWPRLDLMGVRWVVVAPGVAWPGERVARFRLVYDARDGRIFENLSSRPRVFLATRWRVVPGTDAVLAALDAPDFDPAAEALVDREPEWPVRNGIPSSTADVRVDRYAEEEVDLTVATPQKAILVLTDLYWPGWRVDVDDEPATLERADFLFRAVPVPPGTHHVRFRYAVATFRLGLFVTVIATIAVLVAGIASPGGVRSRHSPPPRSRSRRGHAGRGGAIRAFFQTGSRRTDWRSPMKSSHSSETTL
jgi:hypothetical protein